MSSESTPWGSIFVALVVIVLVAVMLINLAQDEQKCRDAGGEPVVDRTYEVHCLEGNK